MRGGLALKTGSGWFRRCRYLQIIRCGFAGSSWIGRTGALHRIGLWSRRRQRIFEVKGDAEATEGKFLELLGRARV